MKPTEQAIIRAAHYWRNWIETRAVERIPEGGERDLARAVDADRREKRKR